MITAEWCKDRAERNRAYAGFDANDPTRGAEYEKYATALTIAARALDEGAVERLAAVLDPGVFSARPDGSIFPAPTEAARTKARAVLAYLRGSDQ